MRASRRSLARSLALAARRPGSEHGGGGRALPSPDDGSPALLPSPRLFRGDPARSSLRSSARPASGPGQAGGTGRCGPQRGPAGGFLRAPWRALRLAPVPPRGPPLGGCAGWERGRERPLPDRVFPFSRAGARAASFASPAAPSAPIPSSAPGSGRGTRGPLAAEGCAPPAEAGVGPARVYFFSLPFPGVDQYSRSHFVFFFPF